MATKKSTAIPKTPAKGKQVDTDRKITDAQINSIDYELTHIEALVQMLIQELPADNQRLDSGLMLIDGQAKKIQRMLEEVFSRKAVAHGQVSRAV